MGYTRIKFTRATLYEEVWTDPVVQVAKRYKMSNVGLQKICRKLGVPVPPLGYWRQIETGKMPARIPLPRHSGPDSFESIRRTDDTPPTPPAPKPPEVIEQQAFESRAENRIVVRDDLLGCHPLVTTTTRGFKDPGIDGRGVTSPRGDNVLAIAVCQPNQRRALLIYDAVLKAVEARGWSVSVTKQYPRRTLIEANGETFAIRLIEKTQRSNRPLTPEEQRKKRYEKNWRPSHPWIFAPTGEFSLHLMEDRYGYDIAVISDTRREPLEHKLNDVMVGIVEAALNLKSRKELARQREAEAAKLAEIRRKKEEDDRREAQELKALEDEISLWERAERIRAYTRAIEIRLGVSSEGPSPKLSAWLEWARKKADHLDPLCDTPNSETEEPLPDMG